MTCNANTSLTQLKESQATEPEEGGEDDEDDEDDGTAATITIALQRPAPDDVAKVKSGPVKLIDTEEGQYCKASDIADCLLNEAYFVVETREYYV